MVEVQRNRSDILINQPLDVRQALREKLFLECRVIWGVGYGYLHLPSKFGRFKPTTPSPASKLTLPSLDFLQQQASQQYWPGASSSNPASTAQQLGTLPTPPSDGTDGFKPPGHNNREAVLSNLATAAVHQPGMASNLEPTGASSSLTSRRPAANNLPSFELPAPFGQQYAQKYTPLPAINGTQSTQASVSVGNLLTPPSTVPGDNLSPISSALNGLNNNSSQGGMPPYNSFAWPPLPTGLTPIGMGSGITPQPWTNSSNQARGLFSPSLSSTLAASLARGSSNSPSATEGLPPPPFDMKYDMSQLPPLPTSISMSTATTLPAIAAQQQAQAIAYMNQSQTQNQTPVSTTTQASPVNGTETYMQRPNSTPIFYSQSQPSSAQQSTFPPFNSNSSPIQQSPMSAPPQGSRISPINAQSANFSPPTSQSNPFAGRSTYGPYSLPAPMSAPAHMSGPIMSNIHNPSTPMGLVGMQSHGLPGGMMAGYNSGHAAHLQQQMYGNPQPTPHNERPFKCDQCPQSFNRNHDLKRHKRIHLAVKPFPCGFCEKSFSRKDALKRHILVKGCGKSISSSTRDRQETPDPQPKDESSDNDESPVLHNTSV
ncbi:MAG: hypothetical protein ASARMPREDX12_005516 [Alectoria sarmentosa]|nr:MAG: hypothetical protein ASARMPREDX12_005516 [Alectoria sarmentosa]